MDDFVVSFEELAETVATLDTTMSKREMKRTVEKEMDKMGKTYLKIFANVGFFQIRMIQGEKRQREIEESLSGEALECFRQNCYKLKFNSELISQRGEEIKANLDRIHNLLEENKEAFQKKYGK